MAGESGGYEIIEGGEGICGIKNASCEKSIIIDKEVVSDGLILVDTSQLRRHPPLQSDIHPLQSA